MKSSLRGAIILIAICSWFAISNHCAFAALASIDTPSSECPFHSKPKEKPGTGVECCKTLRAVASVPAKDWARDDTKLSNPVTYSDNRLLRVLYRQQAFLLLSLDTGPPGVYSFAELILQRSLLVHAPPSRV